MLCFGNFGGVVFTRIMGYTIRTKRYRYTEWVGIDLLEGGAYRPNWEDQAATSELYDLEIDPEENINRIDEDNYTNIIPALSQKLSGGWRRTNPAREVSGPQGQLVSEETNEN